jgi:hypothetical protein
MSLIKGKVGLVDPSGAPVRGGKPQPNQLTEDRINAELAESFDPLLFIKWVDCAYFNPVTQEYEGRYALCCKWPQADKRWSWVKEGKYPPQDAHDILMWFCEDMHNAASLPKDPEAMRPLVFDALAKMDNTRYPWKDRLDKSARDNQKVVEDRKRKAADLVEEAMKSASGTTVGPYGPKTTDPKRLDWSGLEREVAEELESGDY